MFDGLFVIGVFVHCNALLASVVPPNSIEILKKSHTHKVTTTTNSYNTIPRSIIQSILAQLLVFSAVHIGRIIALILYTWFVDSSLGCFCFPFQQKLKPFLICYHIRSQYLQYINPIYQFNYQ